MSEFSFLPSLCWGNGPMLVVHDDTTFFVMLSNLVVRVPFQVVNGYGPSPGISQAEFCGRRPGRGLAEVLHRRFPMPARLVTELGEEVAVIVSMCNTAKDCECFLHAYLELHTCAESRSKRIHVQGSSKLDCSPARHIGHSLALAVIFWAHLTHATVCEQGWNSTSTGASMQMTEWPSCSQS